jgi:hypothetical protein
MLTSLLSGLQSLISSRIIVACFFPSLAFWFAHALMLFELNAPSRTSLSNTFAQSTGVFAAVLGASLIGLAMFAYALSAILPAIQSLLEGNWGDASITGTFAQSQAKALQNLEKRLSAIRYSYIQRPTADAWVTKLHDAQREGANSEQVYTGSENSARLVRGLARRRLKNEPITKGELDDVVKELAADLSAFNATRSGDRQQNPLDDTRELLESVIEYARSVSANQYRRLKTRRRFTFGSWPVSPTRLGNVAQTIQAYALDMYEFNFELLWSRLQLIVKRDKDYGPVVESAKTQLDFLVACTVLTFAWAALWVVWLLATGGPFVAVLTCVVAGFASWVWYGAAVAQYRTFADVVRGAVDLFRFDLLNALHLPLPAGIADERLLWERLDGMQTLGDRRDLRNAHSKGPQT